MSDPGSGSASSQGLSPEEQARAHIAAEIAKMTPEQRQALHAQALEVFMKRRRVQTADGKTVSLARLKRRVDELTRRFESGAYDETARWVGRGPGASDELQVLPGAASTAWPAGREMLLGLPRKPAMCSLRAGLLCQVPTWVAHAKNRPQQQPHVGRNHPLPAPGRSLPRWQVQELTPGHTIRQGAYKMQLREREEAELELVSFLPCRRPIRSAARACSAGRLVGAGSTYRDGRAALPAASSSASWRTSRHQKLQA